MKSIYVRCVFATISLLLAAEALSAGLTEVKDFGSNPGNLQLFEYVPQDLPAGAPLVVVAHGCTQTAQQFADNSGWARLADQYKFALLFPQTSKANEPLGGCFRTWEAEHQQREAGEPLSVKQMVDTMRAQYKLSPSQVFITGMSSGGHLTNVMLATYPDVFAAGAPQSSFPYKCAMALADLLPCSNGSRDLTPLQWGDLLRSGYPHYQGARPRVQIWHGSDDAIIHMPAQQEQLEQWTNLHGMDATVDANEELLGNPRKLYRTEAGKTQVETVTVQGMGHAIAVDPGPGPQQCGSKGAYAEDIDICAAHWIAKFFGVIR